MDKPTSYCQFVERLEHAYPHKHYHDTAHGFPFDDNNALFEQLVLKKC